MARTSSRSPVRASAPSTPRTSSPRAALAAPTPPRRTTTIFVSGIRSRCDTGSIWATPSGSRWATVDTAIVILDGSRLAAIAHRLKLLWNERAVVLPGCLLGVYDLGRGLCRQLTFCADAAASEMTRAKAAVAALGPDTIILGGRLHGTADF